MIQTTVVVYEEHALFDVVIFAVRQPANPFCSCNSPFSDTWSLQCYNGIQVT